MTRAELYALVWEHPAVHVAKRFGISSARLRKICEDYNVPLPPAGYWAKRAHGKDVAPVPLPDAPPTFLGRINSALRRFGEVPLQIADAQIDSFDVRFDVQAATQAAGRTTHPLAATLRAAIDRAVPDENGFLGITDPHLPAVYVGIASATRAVALIDALLAALLHHGHTLSEEGADFRILADGQPLALKLYEARLREGRPNAAQHSPSGKLCLELHDPRPFLWSHRNIVGQWHDRRGQPLEERFDDVLSAIAGAVSVIKLARARADAQEKSLADEIERRREVERRETAQRRGDDYLKDKARAYAEYEQLVRLADHVASVSREPGGDVSQMKRQLDALIARLRAQFEPDALNAEIARKRLFEDGER